MAYTILLFVLAKACFFYGIGFTEPSSRLRQVLFLVIAFTSLLALRDPIILHVPGAVANDYIVGLVFHASNFLLLARRAPPATAVSRFSKAHWAFREIFAARWDVSHIPHFSDEDPHYVPSQRRLFFLRSFDFTWTASLAYYLEWHQPLEWQDYHAPNGFLRRWHQVSQRELLVRMYFAFIGSCIPYLGLRAGHSFASCVALACGARSEDWPPLYGNLSDAYTVRRWYSHFWHHAMRRGLVSHASFLTKHILILSHKIQGLFRTSSAMSSRPPSPKSSTARYLTTVLTFLVSALMHILTCQGLEFCMILPQLRLHLGTAAAVVAEDFIIASYRPAKQRLRATLIRGNRSMKQLVSTNEADDVLAVVLGRRTPRHYTASEELRRRTGSDVLLSLSSVQRFQKQEWLLTEKRESMSPDWQPKPTARVAQDDPSLHWRVLGHIWVAMFWTWSVSGLMYSIYSCWNSLHT